MSILYIWISGFVLGYFECVAQPDGTYTLLSNPTFQCFKTDWLNLFPVFLFGVALYVVGIPLSIGYFLRKYRNALDTDRIYSLFGMLYIRYKQPMYFWELIIIARKLGIVVIKAITVSVTIQASLCLVLMAAFAGIQMKARPYLTTRHNMAEFVLIIFNIIFLFLGLIHYVTKFSDTAMNALVILILVGSLLYILGVFAVDSYIHFKILRKAEDDMELDEQ